MAPLGENRTVFRIEDPKYRSIIYCHRSGIFNIPDRLPVELITQEQSI